MLAGVSVARSHAACTMRSCSWKVSCSSIVLVWSCGPLLAMGMQDKGNAKRKRKAARLKFAESQRALRRVGAKQSRSQQQGSSEEAKWSKSQGAQKKQQNSQGVKMSRSQGVQKKPNGPRSAPAPEKKVVLYARQSSGSTWTHGRKRQFDAGAAAIKSYMAANNVKKFKTRRVGEIKMGLCP